MVQIQTPRIIHPASKRDLPPGHLGKWLGDESLQTRIKPRGVEFPQADVTNQISGSLLGHRVDIGGLPVNTYHIQTNGWLTLNLETLLDPLGERELAPVLLTFRVMSGPGGIVLRIHSTYHYYDDEPTKKEGRSTTVDGHRVEMAITRQVEVGIANAHAIETLRIGDQVPIVVGRSMEEDEERYVPAINIFKLVTHAEGDATDEWLTGRWAGREFYPNISRKQFIAVQSAYGMYVIDAGLHKAHYPGRDGSRLEPQ